jgi:hypothetical protein
MKEPYAYYLKQLANNEVAFTTWRDGENEAVHTTYAQVPAREIVQIIARDDRTVVQIAEKYAKEIDQIPHLKKWLQARVAGR